MTDMTKRILRRMQDTVRDGKHPITEGYLWFVFEDVMDDYYGLLSRSEKKAFFVDLKQHFRIDKQVLDLWAPPDGAFERRVLEAFSARLIEVDYPFTKKLPIEVIFYKLIWKIIDEELAHFPRGRQSDLLERLKIQLNL